MKTIAGPVSVSQISGPGAINNAGHAVATVINSTGTAWTGFIYDGASTKQACGLDHAFAISSADRVFGWAPYKIKGKNVEDYSTCQGATQTDLGVSATQVNAKAANDNGDAAGFKYVVNNNEHAILWKGGGAIQDLGTLGGTNSATNAINGSGVVAGGSDTTTGPTHAFRYNATTDSRLVDLGVPQGWNWSTARGINNVGDIVGTAGATTCCSRHAYVWQRGSQPFDLGMLLTLPAGGALAINNLGEVVGQYWDGASLVDDGSSTGFLYVNGQMYDLNALIPPTSSVHVFSPYDINNSGQIIAEAYDASKRWYWVVLTPQTAPTPATPMNTSPPQISGLPISGDTLNSGFGSWGGYPATYAIQWMRCSASASDCNDIPGATNSSYLIGSGDVGFTLRVRVTATDEYGSTTVQSAATVVIDTPLNGFRPELRYDSQETYRADAAGELTDNCWLDSNSNTHENSLYDSSGTLVLATSCGQLSLSYLSPTYPSGGQATSDDRIDEYPSQTDDFQRMHLMPQYGDRVYGRVFPYPDGESILQYWFWYYNQPNFLFHNVLGGHEGDWEGIQIHLAADGHPLDATYDQHGDGELCDWSRVTTLGSNGLHPLVFVADNSHASYFTTVSEGVGGDSANGRGPQITPDVEQIYDQSPAWLLWPGHWGGSTSASQPFQASPAGPGQKQEQWTDPRRWQQGTNISACSVSISMQARRSSQASGPPEVRTATTVPAPRVRAHRVGKRALVRYCFATVPRSRSRRPAVMQVSVQSANKRVPPYTTQSHVHLPCGRVNQPIGLGRSPFHVLVSAFSRTGARSRVVTVPLR